MRPEGVVDAARALLAEGTGNEVAQVYQITLRDADKYDDNPRVVTLIPIGRIIGIVVHRADEQPKDADIVFVAADALSAAMPALGFTARPAAAFLVSPK